MLTIWIVEDQMEDARHLRELLSQRLEEEKIPYTIQWFQTSQETLDHDIDADLVCMDIEIGSDSGLDLACELKKRSPKIQILLTSSYPGYSIEGYRTGALRFLLKPVDRLQLDAALSHQSLVEMAREDWIMEKEITDHPLPISKIIYLESMDRSTILHTSARTYETSKTLKEWKKQLESSGFVQCYKSILVSLSWIESMDMAARDLLLKNGQRIPFSRHFRKEVQEKLREYIWNTF